MSKAYGPADQERRLTITAVAENLVAVADAFAVQTEDVRDGSARLATKSMPVPVWNQRYLTRRKRLLRLAGVEK
jgi:hypothetical protein